MSWSDPIVEEVRRAREAYAARFKNDLRAIFRDLKEQEKRSGRKVVSYAENKGSNQVQQPPGTAAPASESSKAPEAAPSR